jgi:quinol monooxygenase YgiN
MAVAFIMDFAGGTLDDYDAVIEKMQLGGQLPAGGLFHAAGVNDDGLRVCDVWESEEAFGAFAEGTIIPTVTEVGLPTPEVRSFEANEVRGGATGPVGFVQIVSIAGANADDFRALDEKVTGPSGELPEACVYHVNGALGDGYTVLDYWTSKAARDEFMQSKVAPAMAAAGIAGEPVIEELTVHNSMPQRAPAGV